MYDRTLTLAQIQADMTRPVVSTDTTPPTAPSALTASGSATSAQLGWGAASDDTGVVRYSVYRGTSSGFTPSLANRVAQPTGTGYTDAGLAAGTYFYQVAAEDAAGNVGPLSNEASATVGDAVAPSAPGLLSAAGSVGRATLSWGAASDNVAVVRYNVHRGTSAGFTPSVANRIAQPSGLSYVDLTSPGSYFYRVTAEDAAGNIGPVSNEAAATVSSDTTAPSAPSGLAAPVTGSTASLSWSASTDDVGVVRYNVHRGTSAGFTPSAGNRIAQPTATSYADTGLATGSYFYKVTAEDAAGNTSAASNEAAATVADATPPSVPGTLTATATASTSTSPGAPPPTTSPSAATTSTAAPVRLHPLGGEPDRATDRAQLRRHRPRPRQLLLQARPPKTPPATSAPLATPPAPPSPTPPRPAPPP